MLLDYYKILGLKPNATKAQLREAYKAKALETHPDKNPDVDTALFIKIKAAYNYLSEIVTV